MSFCDDVDARLPFKYVLFLSSAVISFLPKAAILKRRHAYFSHQQRSCNKIPRDIDDWHFIDEEI